MGTPLHKIVTYQFVSICDATFSFDKASTFVSADAKNYWKHIKHIIWNGFFRIFIAATWAMKLSSLSECAVRK